ncbi:sulfate adenylyltransferase subunit 1 [Conexibacter sp. SYSU D00693]|uniref:sulfate adenylyltransferase subunit 1 n=1 Tax=Conexibacter sp. SYSU D00693 TaxID=2812560 RepID=UPI00196B16BD|nr:GTP-binding protein [Conexibacter sp. SYSU D00693]
MSETVTETQLVRLATAGSVDDGKSTLIGRLMWDAKAILSDQEDDLRGRDGELDLSRLTDGLRAEREQGITIDVAYRYFATPRRRFILADTPGHVQYTRNMVTGASTADLAIVLVDARHGVVEQTRRHAFLASLLGIPHLVVAVNKMDLVDFAEERFDEIVRDFCAFRDRLAARDVAFVPISALRGDNVVDRSEAMPWYGGLALLEHLETVDVARDRNTTDLRFPVQYVIREGQSDFRGLAGSLASGTLRPGDAVRVLPSGVEATVAEVRTYDGPLEAAEPPMAVTVVLDRDVDASRGDVLVHADAGVEPVRELEADVCWFSDRPLTPRARLLLKHHTRTEPVLVDQLVDRVDVGTLDRAPAPAQLELNDIGRVRLRTRTPLVVDPYEANRAGGAFILVDEATNETVAGGMVR